MYKFTFVLFAVLLFLTGCKTYGEKIRVKTDQAENQPVCMNCPVSFMTDTIARETFEKYKKLYNSKMELPNARISRTATSFSVHTADSSFVFPADTMDYSHFAYYEGFLSPLNLHIVTYIDGNNEVGYLFLIDQKTNKKYIIESPFDDPCLPPLISPKNNYLIAFSNDSYTDNNCCIDLLSVNKTHGRFVYENKGRFEVDQWKIKELVWTSENSFALHIVVTTRDENSNETTEKEDYLEMRF
jgi:hypothetical protein